MARKEKKKNSRMRGRTTHGWGSMKKHRGAGNRGGRGNAGSTKQKASRYPLKGSLKKGFKNLNSSNSSLISINAWELNSIADKLVNNGKAKAEGGVINLDLNLLGIEKLLGKGQVHKKLNVTVYSASAKAIEKIEAAGGKVTVLNAPMAPESDDSE